MQPTGRPFTIVQLSDLHCGQQFFLPNLLERAIAETNELAARRRRHLRRPDLARLQGRVRARAALRRDDRLRVDDRHPGQPRLAERRLRPLRGALRRPQLGAAPERRHDRRRRLDRAGPRQRADRPRPLRLDRRAVRGSGRPEASSSSTTTCCPCREPAASGTSSTTRATRSSACSAPASTSCSRGHKHVPYAWRLEDLFIVNAGTVSSSRLRGNGRPCYNIVEVSGTHVDVWRKYPFHGQERIIQFSTETKTYEKYTARIEGEVTSNR